MPYHTPRWERSMLGVCLSAVAFADMSVKGREDNAAVAVYFILSHNYYLTEEERKTAS